MYAIAAAGVDTWSPCWRLDEDSPAARAADQLAVVPTARGRLLPDPVRGHRVTWFASARLLAAEGHPDPGGLAHGDGLVDVLAALTDDLHDLGVPVPREGLRFDTSAHGFAGVRRLDATLNMTTDDTATGVALMSGVAALQPGGRLQVQTIRQPGGRAVETVNWRGARGTVARIYDKGVESNTAARGRLLRLEDQRRWKSGFRRDVEELSAATVRDTFMRRFRPLYVASRGVTIVTAGSAAKKIEEAVRDGRITPGQAVDAAGYLFLQQAGRAVGDRTTRWRHRKIVQELGLVLNDGVLVEAEVEREIDLEGVLTAVMDTDAWERRG